MDGCSDVSPDPTRQHETVREELPLCGPTRVTAASAGRKTPERKELSGRLKSANSLPEGEIDAIVTVIELDIISIIITIISIIITAVSTAAPRHRCNN
ncbi:hypothetical protein QYE76_020217 [Lolium multiflorum]|uniref:Uncharacterized protein n=1 Tax=Lolium multiflorum TaxID=4521 RepID=A0AAD8R4E4_LOLMU|nr:hypothetical protein QYE76_020217 [Lolium multiflorum]